MDSKLYLAFTKAYLSNTLDHDDESAIDNQNIQNDDNELNYKQLGVKNDYYAKK